MTASLPPLVDDHDHPRPDGPLIAAILDPTKMVIPPDRTIDPEPLYRVMAAINAQCRGCQTLMIRWLAAHGDPWLIASVGMTVVRDATRLQTQLRTVTSRFIHLNTLLAEAFGLDVASVLGHLTSPRPSLDLAADTLAALDPDRRAEVVRSIFDGLAHPPPRLDDRRDAAAPTSINEDTSECPPNS